MTQQYVNSLDDIRLSTKDTLQQTFLNDMKGFFDKHSKKLYKNNTGNAAHFAFTGCSMKYNYEGQLVQGDYFLQEHTYLCHEPFNHINDKCTGVINLYSKCIRPSARPFLEFILSSDGVFGAATKQLTVIRDKDNDNHPMGTVITNMRDMPIKVYASFQIAGRLLTGWGIDLIWYRLVSGGFSPESALILTPLYSWGADGVVLGSCYRDGRFSDNPRNLTCNGPFYTDQPFSLNMGDFSPRRVMDHNPTDATSTNADAKPNPCNDIWHSSNKAKYFYTKDGTSKITDVILGKQSISKKEISEIENTLYDEKEVIHV